MPALRLRHRDPSHHLRKLSVGARPQQQMLVIRNQTIRRNPYITSVVGFAENFFECRIVPGLVEQRQPTDSSV